jgi:GntR family transcriptional regulator
LRASLAQWLDEAQSQGLSGQEVTALFRSAYGTVYPSGTDG